MNMWNRDHRLLNPDSVDAPAAPVAAPSSTPAAPAAPSATPSQPPSPARPAEPSGGTRSISDAEYERLTRNASRVSGLDQEFHRIRQAGFGSVEDVLAAAQQYNSLRKDPNTGRILQALSQPTPEASDVQTDTPITTRNLGEHLTNALTQYDQRKTHEQIQREHAYGVAEEDRLIGAMLTSDPALKAYFEVDGKPLSLQDAFEGKGTPAASLLSAMIDAATYGVADKYPDGSAKPVRDPAKIQQVRDTVANGLKDLYTTFVHAASSQPRDDSSGPRVTGHPVNTDGTQENGMTYEQQQAEHDKRAGQDMARRFRELTTGGGGSQPLSRG